MCVCVRVPCTCVCFKWVCMWEEGAFFLGWPGRIPRDHYQTARATNGNWIPVFETCHDKSQVFPSSRVLARFVFSSRRRRRRRFRCAPKRNSSSCSNCSLSFERAPQTLWEREKARARKISHGLLIASHCTGSFRTQIKLETTQFLTTSALINPQSVTNLSKQA